MSQKTTFNMVGSAWYDRKGKPFPRYKIGSDKWLKQLNKIEKLLADRDYKIVKQEIVGNYKVSTVWLGLDHSFSGKPLIFETMVFKMKNGKTNYLDIDMERYATEKEAIKGHKKMVKKYKELNDGSQRK